LEITYVANEGVLISSGDKQVLIDGLHREYKRYYAYLPTPEREKIESAKAPFDKIDLILVSHLHLDHFHTESVGLHLQHNPEATLVSSQQVVEEVEKNFKDYEAIKARVTGATPPLKERVAMKVAGIDFEVLGLGHGSGSFHWIQNLGHVIKLGGKKLLHVGDVDTSAEIFEKFNLDEEGIDIAFIPVWFLLYKRRTVNRQRAHQTEAHHRRPHLSRRGRESSWTDQAEFPECSRLHDYAGKEALLNILRQAPNEFDRVQAAIQGATIRLPRPRKASAANV
jgi:L-ascorbate metabolism protein UlaG (beta-lactamase superfamily)